MSLSYSFSASKVWVRHGGVNAIPATAQSVRIDSFKQKFTYTIRKYEWLFGFRWMQVINAIQCPVYQFNLTSGGQARPAAHYMAISSMLKPLASGTSWMISLSIPWVIPIFHRPISWAAGQGFHLLKVCNESVWIYCNDVSLFVKGYTDTYWTGISSQGHPGTWVTRSTGEELDPAAVEFKKGSPSNSDDKLCLAIEYQKDLGRYQFVDYPCSNEYVIVCEARYCH